MGSSYLSTIYVAHVQYKSHLVLLYAIFLKLHRTLTVIYWVINWVLIEFVLLILSAHFMLCSFLPLAAVLFNYRVIEIAVWVVPSALSWLRTVTS